MRMLSFHRVENKVRGGELLTSDNAVNQVREDQEQVLMSYFCKPFSKVGGFYNFTHPTDLMLNHVFKSCVEIFDDPLCCFHDESIRIARHLYETHDHPNIKDGDLFVAYIQDVIVEDEVCDAIGIFKSENKQPFINLERYAIAGLTLERHDGINIDKLDKGCFIFNTERNQGMKLCIVDNTNSSEAVYWKEVFLRVKPREDSYYQTRGYMDACKQFVKEVFNSNNEVPLTDQSAMLNKTADFFKKNEMFDEDAFTGEVLQQPEIIEAFKDHKEKYERLNGMSLKSNFDISTDAAKKMQKIFKSVIKLDKNFHLYMHGDNSLVERGYDEERGMKFYKVYFEKEA